MADHDKFFTKRGRGRPTKLTDELTVAICSMLRVGNYINVSAALNGISQESVYAWLRRGEVEKRGMYWEFLQAVRKAQAEAEAADVIQLAKMAKGNWKALAWKLERRFPERWGRVRDDDDGDAFETARRVREILQQMRDSVASAPPVPRT